MEAGKGELVCREGDLGDAIYLVISGRCQSMVLLPEGSHRVLDIFTPGDTFGERALLSQSSYWATVQVVTDSVLLRLDGNDVHRVVDRTPRMARAVVHRFRQHIRTLNEHRETLRKGLGRVVAISGVAESVPARMIGANLACAIHQETGGQVLFIRILHGREEPRLAVPRFETGLPSEWGRLRQHILPVDAGYSHLTLYAEPGELSWRQAAPFISCLAPVYQYIVISTDAQLDARVMEEFQKQADLSYVLVGQSSGELYSGNLFLRDMQNLFEHARQHIRPVVCLRPGDRCQAFSDLADRLGADVHAVLQDIPEPTGRADQHYLHHPQDRFSANIRYLAREIGRCRVGIALAAGGAKAFAHIGVFKVLEANGIHVDVVAGTSMGAYLGSLYAYGLPIAEIEKLALDMEGRFGLIKVMDLALPPNRGFIKGDKFRRVLEQSIGDAHFSDMMLPLRVVSTDLDTLEKVVFDSGPVSLAVQSSMAMPGVVVPVEIGGRTLVDGAASDPLPVDVLMGMGVERIIAVNIIPNAEEMIDRSIEESEWAQNRRRESTGLVSHRVRGFVNVFEVGNILDIFMRSMHALQTRIVEGSCKQADVVLRPVSCRGQWNDFANSRKYIARGEEAAQAQVEALRSLAK